MKPPDKLQHFRWVMRHEKSTRHLDATARVTLFRCSKSKKVLRKRKLEERQAWNCVTNRRALGAR
jgi:hypothetical protein